MRKAGGPTAEPKQLGVTEMGALAKPLLLLGLMGAATAAVPSSASAQGIFVRPAFSFGFGVPYYLPYTYPAYWGTYGYYGYRPFFWRPRFYGFYGYRPYYWRHAYGFYRPYWRGYHRYGWYRPYWGFRRPYWGYHRYGWYGYRPHWRHFRRF
jgi:hypothetical protein